VGQSINDLSVALSYWGDEYFDETLQLDRRALAINIEQLGEQSVQAAQGYNNLAASLLYRDNPGDKEEAAELFQRALGIRVAQLGHEHANTLSTKSNLANTLHDLDQFESAEVLFKEAIAGLRKTLGESHSRLGHALYGYGHLLVDLGQLDNAAQTFQQAVAVYQSALPEDHPYIADTAIELGKAQLADGKAIAALESFRLAESILGRRDDSHEQWYEARLHLGEALLVNGETKQSRQVLEQLRLELSADDSAASLLESSNALLERLE